MALTPDELKAYLRVMREEGVRRFQWGDWAVEMGPEQEAAQPREKQGKGFQAPKTLFQNASLWPGGVPPKFPGEAE